MVNRSKKGKERVLSTRKENCKECNKTHKECIKNISFQK